MEKSKAKMLRAGVYLLFFAAFFCMFYFGLRDVLQGWEEHTPLFRYSPDYVLRYRYEYLNVIFFCNAFWVQFSYYPALGALLYAALFTLLTFGINRLAFGRTAETLTPIFGFGIAACLLPMFPYTFCVWPIILLLIVAGGFLWRATTAHKPHHIALRVVLMIAYAYILRDYAVLAWGVYSLIDATRTTDRPRRTPRFLFYLIGWVILTVVFIALWRPYEFIPKSRFLALYTLLAANVFQPPFSFFHVPRYALAILYIGLLCIIFSPLLRYAGKKARTVLSILLACIGLVGFGLTPFSAHQLTVFFKADRHIRCYEWKEAWEILEKDYPLHEGTTEVTHAEVVYQTQLKTCLLALRKASDRLFTYNLMAFPMLLPEQINNRAEAYVLPPYYVYSGNYSESLHLSYDWCTGGVISPAVLSQLITASLILNDTLPASKFLFLLNQTLFRQKDVLLYSLQNPEFRRVLERGRKFLPASNYRVDAYLPDKNAVSAYVHNPGNALFYEYFLNLCMTNKDLYTIGMEWEKIKQSYSRHVPRHLQEALLATYNYTPARYIYPQNIEGIEAETWNDYWAFILDDQAYQNEQISFEQLQQKWRHTFWFFHLYKVYKTH